MSNTIPELAEKIIRGHRVKRGDDLSIFLESDLEELQKGAGAIQKHFRKNHIAEFGAQYLDLADLS